MPDDPDTQAQRNPADGAGSMTTQVGATRSDSSGAPGTIPGYEIGEQLGQGGMGVVFKARDTKLNRLVALKLIRGAGAVGGSYGLLSEAEKMAAVRHPHVVQVYGYGESDRGAYLILELCAGGTLADRLRASGRLAPRAVAELVERVARGVAAAHDAGIVHRDLKPGNVLFDAAGAPKVADFGLAKRATADLAQTGLIQGTPSYMSPEQAAGSKFIGPSTDVWALGVILYECLTGRQPFVGGDTLQVLERVRADDPAPVRRLVSGVPRDLEVLVARCLSKDPTSRFATAGELADELRRFLDGEPIRSRRHGAFEGLWRAVSHSRLGADFAHWGNVLLVVGAITVLYHVTLHALRATGQPYWLRPLTHCAGIGLVAGTIWANLRRLARVGPLERQLVTIFFANFAAYGVMDVLVWQMTGAPWPFDDAQMYPYFFVLNGLCFCVLGSSHLGVLTAFGLLCWVIALVLPFALDYAYLINAAFWGFTFVACGCYFRRLGGSARH